MCRCVGVGARAFEGGEGGRGAERGREGGGEREREGERGRWGGVQADLEWLLQDTLCGLLGLGFSGSWGWLSRGSARSLLEGALPALLLTNLPAGPCVAFLLKIKKLLKHNTRAVKATHLKCTAQWKTRKFQ